MEEVNYREIVNNKRLTHIQELLNEYGEWNLGCVYVNDEFSKFGYGTLINLTNDNKVQISIKPMPNKRDFSVPCVQRNIFIEPCNVLEIYKKL